MQRPGCFDDRHAKPMAPQLLGHLESDEPAAHHDAAATLATFRPRCDLLRIGNVAH
jgi:hypothetical protein